MPNRHAPLKLVLGRALLLVALPLSACATGVEPEFEDQPLVNDDAGSGGALAPQGGSSAGKSSPPAKAGTSASGSSANPFGGSASAGGKAGSNAGGAGGGSGGSKAGDGGSAGSSSAGTGGDACACAKTLTWTDNTVMSWAPGDCVTAGTTTYVYVGAKAQTYANGQCNPSKQEPWCPDTGNDYKFMACP